MQLLTRFVRGTLLGCLTVVMVTLMVAQSVAHPPEEPDHGLNETTFVRLWAGDEDITNETEMAERLDSAATNAATLATMTDIPLDAPPRAAEQWNRRDHRDFPATDRSTSVHPPDATLQDGDYIRDATAAIFTVQPSTKAHLAPDRQPLFVAPNGTLLGTADYRIEVPAASTSANRSVSWQLVDHNSTTRLLVDGQVEAETTGTHTPTLSYANLDHLGGESHTLTLETTVTATVRKTVRRCTVRWNPTTSASNTTANETHATTITPNPNSTNHSATAAVGSSNRTASTPDVGESRTPPRQSLMCITSAVTVTNRTESVTARDSVNVSVYTLSVTGYRTRYPNGDLGLTAYKNQPWRGYSNGDVGVSGVWQFYAARDRDWDTLVTTTGQDSSTAHAPLHPVQVHAYPVEAGPTPSSRARATLLGAYGEQTMPPSLPSTVQLDVVTSRYTASYGLATRLQTNTAAVGDFTAYGLVRGVKTDLGPEQFVEVPFHRSNLSVTLQNASAETATVEVTLHDAATGAPIETQTREGYVVVNGRTVNTGANGTATITVSLAGGSVTARYEPGRWWRAPTAYTGDSAITHEGTSAMNLVTIIYQTGVPIGLFLLTVFLIDRITGWEVWPPWGRY